MSSSSRKLHLTTVLQEGHGFKLHKKLLMRKANKANNNKRLELIADCPLLLTVRFHRSPVYFRQVYSKSWSGNFAFQTSRSALHQPARQQAVGQSWRPPGAGFGPRRGTGLLPQEGCRAEGWRRRKAGTRGTITNNHYQYHPSPSRELDCPTAAALPNTLSTEPTLPSGSAAAHMDDIIDITPPPRSRPNERRNGNRPAPRAWPCPCTLKESWRGVVFVVGSGFSYVRDRRVLLKGLAQLHPSDSYTLAEEWLQRSVQPVWPHNGDHVAILS